MLGQVVLLRELNVAFFGSELIYILALGVWLFWTAAGAAMGRGAHVPSGRRVRWLLLLLGLALPLVVVFARGLRILFGAVPGAYLPFARQMAAMGLALLPISLMLGLLFQWAAKIYVASRGTLAAAYAIESVGGLAGGILATVFLMLGMRNFTAGLICALLSVGAAFYPWRRERPRGLRTAGALAALFLLAALGWSADLDARLTAWNHPALVATRDSPYSRVTITEESGLVSVFENDALSFESEGTTAEEFVHLAAVQRPALDSVLVLGGGVGGLVRELLLHGPARIDYVELNEILLEIASPHLPADIRASLSDERVRLTIGDPRRFLERSGAYDLILVGMPEPASGQMNRFYTREFFARCAARLNEAGVLALRLRGSENLWTPQLARRTGSIYRALRSVFEDVVVLPGVTNIIVASREPLERDPASLGGRLTERGIEALLVIPAYVGYLYTNDRFFELNDLLARTEAPVNSDARPICYQYTLLVWLSRFFLAAALMEVPDPARLAGSPWLWLGIVVVAGVLLVSRRWSVCRRSLLAAAAGFVGMVLETALILQYQTIRGVLYQDIGLLLTMFMAGLALGSAGVHGLARRGSGKGLTRLTGALLLGAFAMLSLLAAWLLPAGLVAGLGGTSALLLACGFLVAALFAYASLHREPDQKRVVSPLYAADLAGGCVGSLAASLFLIPVAGFWGAAVSMVLAAVLAALLL